MTAAPDDIFSFKSDADFACTDQTLCEAEELATVFTQLTAQGWPDADVFCLAVALLATSIPGAFDEFPNALSDDMRRYVGRKLVEAGHAMMGGVN
jgi:hypothetical protein